MKRCLQNYLVINAPKPTGSDECHGALPHLFLQEDMDELIIAGISLTPLFIFLLATKISYGDHYLFDYGMLVSIGVIMITASILNMDSNRSFGLGLGSSVSFWPI